MSGQQQRLPLEVDPFRLATREEHLQGSIPFKQLNRLEGALSSVEGDEVHIDVEFSIDINRVVLLTGQINTDAKLICQRCMEEMELSIALNFQLAFVRSETEMERLPEEYDATLLNNKTIMLSDIIEEEILLFLPSIPKHLNESCYSNKAKDSLDARHINEQNIENVKRQNPFDVLASLKTDK